MDDRPIHDGDIYEAMEVCRPRSDDISDPSIAFLAVELAAHPELDERYEQLQRLDGKIAGAFDTLPVPAGLADRIIARLALSQVEEPAATVEAEVATAGAGEPESPRPAMARLRSRRWMLAMMGGLATAVSILVIVLASLPSDSPLTKDTVVKRATELFASSRQVGAQGHLFDEEKPPRAYPFSSDFLKSPPGLRWRRIADFLGLQGVAYDMVNGNGTKGTLYVLQGTIPGLPAAPPEPECSAATEQFSVGAWQSGGLLYVLVVNGGTGEYRQFLDNTQRPLI